ncbi:MAG: hypothetical protein GX620_15620 [Chloroflexi bacterium]|nr:hypothetical protein [Chloroflexota bacterium]
MSTRTITGVRPRGVALVAVLLVSEEIVNSLSPSELTERIIEKARSLGASAVSVAADHRRGTVRRQVLQALQAELPSGQTTVAGPR